MNAWRRLAVLPIRFYQRYLSPLKPPSCRFHPTCSAYACGAILAHGFFKGCLLATWRILRCQPFSEGGFDPVPTPGTWRAAPRAAGGDDPAQGRDPGDPAAPEKASLGDEKRG